MKKRTPQYKFRKLACLLACIFLCHLSVSSTETINIGVPSIQNYTKKDYRAGTQNWSIAQDKKGFMYFGNNEGLLVFDGVTWQLHRMPNSSIVRSLYIADNGQIYIGAYNDLGKMITDINGKMEFRSLKKYIPANYHNFDDIWNITTFEDQIVYQSYNCAYLFSNDSTVSIIKAPVRFQNSFQVNGRLYFNDIEKGLMEYVDDSLKSLTHCEQIQGEEIWSILPLNQDTDLMVCTLNKGIYLYSNNELKEWSVPANTLFKQEQIFSASIIPTNQYAIGTIQNGVYIIDKSGNIIQHINRQKGLQNNTILKTGTDQSGNLWLGLDNGIDYVNINSPITFLQQTDGIGAGYTSIIFEKKIYLGTNQGLFVKDWDNNIQNEIFRLIPGTNGQVWYLGIHDEILLCGHNNGTYIISGEQARQISKIPGAWKLHALERFPGYLIGGTYSGLTYYKKEKGSWEYSGKIKGFNESFRVFEEDEQGNLWMSHGFKGIYKVTVGQSLESIQTFRFYTSKDGLPTNYNLNVFKIKGKVVVTSNVGIFEFNPKTDQFEHSTYFNQILSPLKDISYLKEDQQGNIWYQAWILGKNSTGIFRIQKDMSYIQESAPFALLTGKSISGFESIYPYSNNHIFFGTEAGFAHYTPVIEINPNREFSSYINQATASYLDSTFFYGNSSDGKKETDPPTYSFPYRDNTFRFSYTSPFFENQDNIEYSFLLSGSGNKWSKWSHTTFTEYANLPSGEYVFIVKARNQMGIESQSDSLPFEIRAPWYKSNLAYFVYFLVFVCIVFLGIWIVVKRIEITRRKERLKHLRSYRQKEQDYIRQALLDEKKIISLKNEKLKIEMIHRDKELANQTMDLIRKNKFLVKITEELGKLKNISSDETIKEKVTVLITKIDKDIDNKKQWEIFETAFDDVHEDFLTRLKTLYPNLTPNEIRLCAYLRMNISTKEIAPLMNISVRGVEICRYRVRKKLNIDRDQNLTRMIINL